MGVPVPEKRQERLHPYSSALFPTNGAQEPLLRELHAKANEINGISIDNQEVWPVGGTTFNRRFGTLLVDVDTPELVERIIGQPTLSQLKAHGFRRKDNLHMTVLDYDKGRVIQGALKDVPYAERDGYLEKVEGLATQTDWSWEPLGGPEPFQGRQSKALKIITRVHCPGFDQFFDRVQAIFPDAEFKQYVPHITLLKQKYERRKSTPSSLGGLALSTPLFNLNRAAE